jgi:hypothetical protein
MLLVQLSKRLDAIDEPITCDETRVSKYLVHRTVPRPIPSSQDTISQLLMSTHVPDITYAIISPHDTKPFNIMAG